MSSQIRTIIAGLCALAATAPAFGQAPAAAEDTGGIAEVIVTAQKRAENLQEVPISVAAVSGATVEDMHAVTLQALAGTVPNVQIGTFSNTPNTAVFTIRGIGIIEPDPYAGNTVSIVTDGVPQYFSMGALLDLYDVERIEILRGPQGTLFGANTTGGVVNVVNGAPQREFGGKIDLSYGNYDHFTLGAVLTGPLSDAVSGRLAITNDRREGFTTNIVDGSDMGKRDVTLVRGALRFDASDDFDATFTGEYVRARNGAPIVVAGNLPGEAEFVPPGWRDMYVSPCLPAGSRCEAPGEYLSANNAVPDISNMDTYSGNLTMNWSNTGVGDLTSITGYKKLKVFEFTDQDGTPATLINTRRQTRAWQFSQELRTSVDISDMVELVAGGYYMKTHYDHYQHLLIDFAGGATYNLADDTYTRGLTGLFQRNLQDQDNSSASVFAQSYIKLNDKLRLQAGVRYTHEETEMEASTATSLAAGGVSTFDGTAPDGTPNIDLGTVAPPRDKSSWDNVGWKLGLDYQMTDDAMVYGHWSRGFKSGGYTGRIGIAQDLGPYDPEEVDTFEFGFKTDLLDNHLRINGAAFYTKYKDMQLAQIYFVGTGQNLVQGNTIINAASSTIKGVELEVTAVPTDGLTLSASLAFLEAKYDDFPFLLPNGNTLDLSGERLQNAPKFAGTLNAQYLFPLGTGEGRFNVQYAYQSEKLLTSITDTARARIQPIKLVNANLDWKPGSGGYTVGLWAKNLFDERYINSVFDAPGTLGLTNYAPPREFGLSVKVEF